MSEQLTNSELGEGGSGMVSLLSTLGEGKKLLFSIVMLSVALAVVFVLLVPRYYMATTVIMPPQQASSGLGALAELSALGAMAGGSGMGLKTSDETYMAFLKTRRLQDVLIKRYDLVKRYEVMTPESARFALSNLVTVSSDKKSGLITIAVEDTDPKFAVELAAAHVAELRKMLSAVAVSEAQQRRAFYELQVKGVREQLGAAELRFLQEQVRSGFVVPQALAESSVRRGAELRAQIAAREVGLQTLQRFATPQNQEVQRFAAELAALRAQLAALESGQGVASSGRGPSGEGAARQDDRAVTAFREMKVREAALESLIRQYELAKLDESREGPVLQEVDAPSASAIPSRPKRAQFVVLTAVVSLLLGSFIVVVRASLRGADEQERQSFRRLMRAWGMVKA